MTILSIFFGFAVAIVLALYISRPFSASMNNPDESIEIKIEEFKKSTQPLMGKVCRKCGHILSKSDRFCSQCGASLEQPKRT